MMMMLPQAFKQMINNLKIHKAAQLSVNMYRGKKQTQVQFSSVAEFMLHAIL